MPPKTASARSKAPAPDSPSKSGTAASPSKTTPKRATSAGPSSTKKTSTTKKTPSKSPAPKTPGTKTPSGKSTSKAAGGKSTTAKRGRSASKKAGSPAKGGEVLHNLSFGHNDQGVDGVMQLYGEIAQEKQDPNAYFTVGWMYLFGLGDVTKDPKKAYAYFLEAAKGGHEMGLYHAALLQLSGSGTRKSVVKAVTNFEKAAELGNALAMFQLGKVYETSHDDELARDMDLSTQWLQKAADAGNELAKKRLEKRA